MFSVDLINPFDEQNISVFPDFFKCQGAFVGLLSDGRLAGAANVVINKNAAIKKVLLLKEFDEENVRRFFLRAITLKLINCSDLILSDFYDALLEEIGFCAEGNGMKCLSKDVVFKKMCGGDQKTTIICEK
ncbi:MAG: hypothetical protein LBQ27_03150 [Clostridiales bacterium]|jgi:hypothetical protein|nr:hypothetical protein [Clostridiales bacterium]